MSKGIEDSAFGVEDLELEEDPSLEATQKAILLMINTIGPSAFLAAFLGGKEQVPGMEGKVSTEVEKHLLEALYPVLIPKAEAALNAKSEDIHYCGELVVVMVDGVEFCLDNAQDLLTVSFWSMDRRPGYPVIQMPKSEGPQSLMSAFTRYQGQ